MLYELTDLWSLECGAHVAMARHPASVCPSMGCMSSPLKLLCTAQQTAAPNCAAQLSKSLVDQQGPCSASSLFRALHPLTMRRAAVAAALCAWLACCSAGQPSGMPATLGTGLPSKWPIHVYKMPAEFTTAIAAMPLDREKEPWTRWCVQAPPAVRLGVQL